MIDCSFERNRKPAKWGEQNHNPEKWAAILGEEFGEYCKAVIEAEDEKEKHYNMINELIHVAAVAIAAIECLVRNKEREEKEK